MTFFYGMHQAYSHTHTHTAAQRLQRQMGFNGGDMFGVKYMKVHVTACVS